MRTLTVAEVVADLHLSRDTVTAYLGTGRIPGGFQPIPGGRWLIDADAYDAWLESRRAAVDPHRIEPRSPRSRAAQGRRRAGAR